MSNIYILKSLLEVSDLGSSKLSKNMRTTFISRCFFLPLQVFCSVQNPKKVFCSV